MANCKWSQLSSIICYTFNIIWTYHMFNEKKFTSFSFHFFSFSILIEFLLLSQLSIVKPHPQYSFIKRNIWKKWRKAINCSPLIFVSHNKRMKLVDYELDLDTTTNHNNFAIAKAKFESCHITSLELMILNCRWLYIC